MVRPVRLGEDVDTAAHGLAHDRGAQVAGQAARGLPGVHQHARQSSQLLLVHRRDALDAVGVEALQQRDGLVV
ncbi:MAG: hypothetical protein ACK559_29310, partial [bacterium]